MLLGGRISTNHCLYYVPSPPSIFTDLFIFSFWADNHCRWYIPLWIHSFCWTGCAVFHLESLWFADFKSYNRQWKGGSGTTLSRAKGKNELLEICIFKGSSTGRDDLQLHDYQCEQMAFLWLGRFHFCSCFMGRLCLKVTWRTC